MISSPQKKPWYRSRTYWFNILSSVLLVLSMPELMAVLPSEWIPKLALINALGNLFLRSVTAGGVSLK